MGKRTDLGVMLHRLREDQGQRPSLQSGPSLLGVLVVSDGADNGTNIPVLDEARWNHHPRMNPKGVFYANPYQAGYWGGPWKRTLATADFAGFCRFLVDFCTDSRPTKNYAPNDGDQRGYGWGYLAHETRDDKIPATPKVDRLPGGGQKFEAAEFSSPAGHKPAALEWRVGRVGQLG